MQLFKRIFVLIVIFLFFTSLLQGASQDWKGTVGGGRISFGQGTNDDGLVFGNLGTATKGIDLSGSGLSGSDYWLYGDANNYWTAAGEITINGTYGLYIKTGVTTTANLQYITADGGTYLVNGTYGVGLKGPSNSIITVSNGVLIDPTTTRNIRLEIPSMSSILAGNSTAVGSLTACTSNGTTTIAKASAWGFTPAAGDLIHITGATTAADKGFYRVISIVQDTSITVDRALAGSDADVALTIYKDVIGIFATDGTNGQRIMNYSHQNKPLQLGGDVLAATTGLVGDDVVIGGSLGINDQKITAGSGTGITVVNSALVNRQVYKVTTTYAAFADSDTTKGVVIATLPAKMKIVGFYADTTTKFIGGAITAATLEVGITAEGAAEIIAAHDVFTAAVTKGLADADMGGSMTRATQIQGGYLPSWTGTTEIFATIDTTTANTDALTQGSTTFYVETEQF